MLILPPRKDHVLKQLEALIPRLSSKSPDYHTLEQQLWKERSGYSGEKSLLYYLDLVDDQEANIIFNCRLPIANHYFQIDCLYLTPRYAVIIEVKNLRGIIYFNQANQMIQIWENVEKPYQDPIRQVNEQRLKLNKVLAQIGYSSLPIHTLVAFTNRNVILNLSKPCPTRITSEQLATRLRDFHKQHQKMIYPQQQLNDLAMTLKQMHCPRKTSIIDKYQIEKSLIKTGIQCSNCQSFDMTRQSGTWLCPQCHFSDKNAHIQALTDYALIYGPTITNKEARSHLNITSRHIANRLLKSENIRQVNQTNHTTYDLSNLID
ncbi:NERD domain-containing protein [Amphibacillus sp. MSJ-3]|uniref:nuclease-related domain-containing protein n=1 Tax=Amphibacillus sp. MSJ-3 TaxID=2841505 RepID=UPI001C0E94B8|nr:nuclease-related domain-containing protein [Amphibacillus sp. MSJ-3]MBU5594863.1 NERD domain-containing protein [Amphibacillus sp. MSJ-3]